MGRVIKAFHFIHRQWARTDETHFTTQNVEELREFVDAPFAKDAADGRDAGIVSKLEDGTGHFVEGGQFYFALLRVAAHGAELEHGERAAIEATSTLPKEDGARRRESDPQGGPCEQRRTKDDQGESATNINALFDDPLPRVFRDGPKDNDRPPVEFVEGRA